MRRPATLPLALTLATLAGCATPPRVDVDPAAQVTQVERAFARTMADRDHAAFAGFIAADAVFVSGTTTLRGAGAVVAAWKRYYESDQAPFSWEPDQVEVLPSGQLALSTGPVRDPRGKLIGRFTSIWRHAAPGGWRIVFDTGSDACDCPVPSPTAGPPGR
jgi:ketosteroid isomerase-like protein